MSRHVRPAALRAAAFAAALVLAWGAVAAARQAPARPAAAKPPAAKAPPAPPPPRDGRTVVEEVQKRSTVRSQHYEGSLRVTDAGGKVSDKRWVYDRLGSHGASKTIIRFLEPAEVKGVALLIYNYPERVSDQWMWTPALNRDRRVAAQDRRTRFFGTDFTFEDLEERDVARYDYTLAGEEAVEGEACWKVEATPKPGVRSQYSRSTLWVRKASYTYAQIDNFSGTTMVRRLNYRNLQSVQGIWTARAIEVRDTARNSRTTLTLDALAYDVPLTESQFVLDALRRG